MYVKCFEIFDCQVLHLRIVVFWGLGLFGLVDAICSGYITELFSEIFFFFFFFFLLKHKRCVCWLVVQMCLWLLLTTHNWHQSWSVFHCCCHVRSLLVITPSISQMGAACSKSSKLENVYVVPCTT